MSRRKILKTCKGDFNKIPPIWFMRQAGRHLPEYRALRQSEESFLDLCYHVEKAVTVSLQPYERYGMDGVILFSDILVIPDALGQKVEFLKRVGPSLEPINSLEKLQSCLENEDFSKLDPIFSILQGLKEKIDPEASLLGFSGAPWTLATYMIQGRSSKDFLEAKSYLYRQDQFIHELFDVLTDRIIKYVSKQIEAGADIIQLFDSWAGSLPDDLFRQFCLEPAKKIVSSIREKHPETGIIYFPKGIGVQAEIFAKEVKPDILSIDSTIPLEWAKEHITPHCGIQGNLDPSILFSDFDVIKSQAKKILDCFSDIPFIFNLGHGIDKNTNPEIVQKLINYIRNEYEQDCSDSVQFGRTG